MKSTPIDAASIRRQLAKIQNAVDFIVRSLPEPTAQELTLQVPPGYRLSRREARRRKLYRRAAWRPDYVKVRGT